MILGVVGSASGVLGVVGSLPPTLRMISGVENKAKSPKNRDKSLN